MHESVKHRKILRKRRVDDQRIPNTPTAIKSNNFRSLFVKHLQQHFFFLRSINLFTCCATGSKIDSMVFVWNTGIFKLEH